MRLTQAAAHYCESRHVARTVVYSANRFARFVGDFDLSKIDAKAIGEFADRAKRAGLAASTVKFGIKDVLTVLHAHGITVEAPRIRVPPPEPEPTPADHLNAIWPHLAAWSRQSVALMFHCCFRLADILRLQCEGIAADATVIRLQAHKTQRNHAFPVPSWLAQYLGPVRLPFVSANDHAAVIVRGELDRVSTLAKVDRVYPRNIRQAGITAWSKANGMAGAIAHGSGLSGSVMAHYVSPLAILESAMSRVQVPAAMRGAVQDTAEDSMLSAFRRLDPSAQALISQTAERLAAG